MDRKPGGHILFRWVDERPEEGVMEDGGPILEVERPERFVFQWQPDNSSYFTTVSLAFEAVEDGTIVRVREKSFQDTQSGKKAMIGCATGWGEALTMLKYYLEHGIRY